MEIELLVSTALSWNCRCSKHQSGTLVLNYLFKWRKDTQFISVCFATSVAGRLGPVIHTSAVYFTVTILSAL